MGNNSFSPSTGGLCDVPFDNKYRLSSTACALQRVVLAWYWRSGLRLVLLEIRSSRHRIRRGLKTKLHRTGLLFDPVYLSLPPLCGRDSCTETQPYILGIQALAKERPWLTLSDLELFLQAWFQAEKCALGTLGIESEIPPALCASCSSSARTGNWFVACPACVARQAVLRDSKRDRSILLPSQE